MKFSTSTILASALALNGAMAFTAPSPMRSAPFEASTRLGMKVEAREIVGEVKPINNFILIKIAAAMDKSDGGILFANSAKVQKTEGTVISVGPGRTDSETGEYCPISLQKGDGVVYGQFDGTELDIDEQKHTLIKDSDVLVKFTGDALKLDAVEMISDKVLVFVDMNERQTEGGLLLASSKNSDTRPSTGTVVKIGPGRIASNGQLSPMTVAEGDTIKFRDYAGSEVVIEGEEYSVVRMPDVLARF